MIRLENKFNTQVANLSRSATVIKLAKRQNLISKSQKDQQAGSIQKFDNQSRKQFIKKCLIASSLVFVPHISQVIAAETETQPIYKEFYDKILAYKYQYPVETHNGQELNFVLTRKPERYSSAAPLSADARQRIVSEQMDFNNSVTIAIYVGAPGQFLKGKNSDQWDPKEIIDAVLTDKSTKRTTKGDKVHFNQIKDYSIQRMNGQKYIIYKSSSEAPNLTAPQNIDYRFSYTSTTWRNGENNTPYLYSFNISTKQGLWDQNEEDFLKAAESFRLTAVDNSYVPPDKEPWRFF